MTPLPLFVETMPILKRCSKRKRKYWVLDRNGTFKFKITPNRHNAGQKLNYCLLPDPPLFWLPSTLNLVELAMYSFWGVSWLSDFTSVPPWHSNKNDIQHALQMKGRWEYNINVLFPFMYSQKWICYFQNRTVMFCLPVPTLIICERFIYFQDRSAYSAAGNMWTDPGNINCSETHEWGKWDWGRAIPKKGIHTWDFPCSV